MLLGVPDYLRIWEIGQNKRCPSARLEFSEKWSGRMIRTMIYLIKILYKRISVLAIFGGNEGHSHAKYNFY